MDTKKEQQKEKRRFQICCVMVFFLTIGCLALLGIGVPHKKVEGKAEILSEKSTKTEETTNQVKNAGTLLKELEIPEHYTKELKSKNQKKSLQIDADIVVPNVDGLGEKLVQPHTMTQERVDEVIKNLFPDGKLYDSEKKEISKKYGDTSQQEEKVYSDKEGSRKVIEQCTVSGMGYTKDKIPYNVYFYNYEKKEPANMLWEEMSISREDEDEDNYIITCDPENGVEKEADLKKMLKEQKVKEQKMNLSQEEAYDIACDWLKKCGIQNFYCQKTLFIPETKTKLEEADNQSQVEINSVSSDVEIETVNTENEEYTGKKAYYFEFGKEIDNIPVLQENYMDDYYLTEENFIDKTDLISGLMWPKEKIAVVVDDNGLMTLHAQGLSDLVGTKKEYVNLLSFKDLEDICQKMLLNYVEGNQEEAGEAGKLEVKINRIELGYIRMLDEEQVKKGKVQGILKPVWCFYGSIYHQYDDSKYQATESDSDSILAISAETGELIAPDLGDWKE